MFVPRKSCPQGYDKYFERLMVENVLMVGELTDTHRMIDAAFRRANNMNLM